MSEFSNRRKITGKDTAVWGYFREKGETGPKNSIADIWLEAVTTDNSSKDQEKENEEEGKVIKIRHNI